MTTRSEWTEYYDEHEGREPREMLLEVLDAFGAGEERSAVDLGCGSGIDTLAMLRRGWRVFAIDAEEEAIERVRRRVPGTLSSRLTTVVSRMEDIELPTDVDLVWASFSLFFCRPDAFGDVWSQILASIRPGGRFAGELLGDRDTWAPEDDISAFTGDEARSWFTDLDIERFDEEEEDGRATSEEKHWHLFHVVARKAERDASASGP